MELARWGPDSCCCLRRQATDRVLRPGGKVPGGRVLWLWGLPPPYVYYHDAGGDCEGGWVGVEEEHGTWTQARPGSESIPRALGAASLGMHWKKGGARHWPRLGYKMEDQAHIVAVEEMEALKTEVEEEEKKRKKEARGWFLCGACRNDRPIPHPSPNKEKTKARLTWMPCLT